MFKRFEKPIQMVKTVRLYRNNPAARPELDALHLQWEEDESFSRDDYLRREAEIVAKYSR